MRDPDARALRSATWRLAGLTAGAITVALLIVGGLVFAVVLREQQGEAGRVLRQAVTDIDDVEDQPASVRVWARLPDGTVVRSPGTPAWLPVQGSVAAAEQEGEDDRSYSRGSDGYRVRTVVRPDGTVVQAAYDEEGQHREISRLVTAVVLAEVVGLGLSLLLGALLARRAIDPLATALYRQRRFVADASHELRTPLTLLSTRAQMLERSLRRSAEPTQHEQALSLVDDAHRMGEVVSDLLLSASVGAQPHRREPVDVRRLAASVAASARTRAHQHDVEVAGPQPPAPSEPRPVVLGIPAALRRVVDSLVDNAVTHAPPGSRVCIDVSAVDGRVTVRVTDEGPGIDPEVAPRLFHRFSHGSAHGERESFGLGLALVREVVEAHGGSVSGHNRPVAGAEFVVSLPVAPGGDRTAAHSQDGDGR